MKITESNTTQKVRSFLTLLLVLITACVASTSAADDTDVFFGAGRGDTRPNVLFVLDTSGSMSRSDGYASSRLDRMKDAVRTMLESDLDLNVGLMNYSGSEGGGPILYPVTALNKQVCAGYDCNGTPSAADNVYLVDGATGDVEELVSNGSVLTDDTDLNFTAVEGSGANVIGLRYADVNIGRGATILDARLEFVARGNHTVETGMLVEIEDVADAQPFNKNNHAVSTRSYHREPIDWYPDEWFDQSVYQSADVAELVQSVTLRPDWCSGNALAFSIKGSGGTRVAYSFEQATDENIDYIPKLRIVQDPSTVVRENNCNGVESFSRKTLEQDDDANQDLDGSDFTNTSDDLRLDFSASLRERSGFGIRFQSVYVPQGSTIERAFIRLVYENGSSGDVSSRIHLQDTTVSQPYSSAGSGPASSTRNYLPDPVAWNVPLDSSGQRVDTPDLAQLIQTVIDHPDWDERADNNAISFGFEPTGGGGNRAFESFDSPDTDLVPELFISFSPPPPQAPQQTFQRSIASSTDDAEQQRDGGSMRRTSRDLDIESGRSTNNDKFIGLRFSGIDIPEGAQIDKAFLRLVSEDDNDGDLSLEILAEDSTQARTYDSDATGPSSSSRSYIPQPVAWNNLPVLSKGENIVTPDLKTLVQTLVDRPGWSSESDTNNISFVLRPTQGSGERNFESWDGSKEDAAELVISYSPTQTTNTPGLGAATGPAATPAFTPGAPIPVYSTLQARDEMLQVVNDLSATNATPTVDAFYEAALYMRGEDVDYGKRRGVAARRVPQERFRVSHPGSYTGGVLQREDKCTDENLNSGACRSEKIQGDPTYISPMTGSCQENHIILLSDGRTNNNSSTSKILSMTGKSACTERGNEACATDLASWLLDSDHSGLDEKQQIITHTIAFNLRGSGKRFLERVAEAGGGKSYEADTSDELLSVFNELASSVIDVDTGFTAPSATVNQFNRLTNRDDLYFALFKPSKSAAWDGNIKRFRLGKDNDDNGEVLIRDLNGTPAIDASTGFFADNSRSWWPERRDDGVAVAKADGNTVARGGVANQLPPMDTEGVALRRVYTWLSAAGTPTTDPIDLTTEAQKFHESNELITNEMLGISEMESGSNRELLIQWARGVDVFDDDKDGSRVDIRRSIGDPMHSRPIIVNYPPRSSSEDAHSIVYVGTNEGYLHAFDTSNGREEFAYIPYELLGNLNTFYNNELDRQRPYGLDGTISLWRDDKNQNAIVDDEDSVLLFVGMRRGGSSYYALDISDPDSPKLAWSIKSGTTGFEDLGQSWSRMTPVKMSIDGTIEDVLVFGGGYDENQDYDSTSRFRFPTIDQKGRGIYIVNAKTGKLIWSGLGKNGGTVSFRNMQFGFNSPVRTVDIDRDGNVDQMYAADAGGQVWRFDITPNHTGSSNTLVSGGIIASLAGFSRRNRRRFYNEPDVALNDDGGEQFLSISIGSGWRAHPLDETTQDRFYMLKQYAVFNKPNGYGKAFGSYQTPVAERDLVDITNTLDSPINRYGWYLKLNRSGEKVLGTSVTFGGNVIFSTYVPSEQTASCAVEIGSGRAYVLDVATGAPVFNLDDSGDTRNSSNLTLEDRSMQLDRSGIPPEAMIMMSEGSEDQANIVIGGELLSTGIDNRTRRTFWSDEGESGEFRISEESQND